MGLFEKVLSTTSFGKNRVTCPSILVALRVQFPQESADFLFETAALSIWCRENRKTGRGRRKFLLKSADQIMEKRVVRNQFYGTREGIISGKAETEASITLQPTATSKSESSTFAQGIEKMLALMVKRLSESCCGLLHGMPRV